MLNIVIAFLMFLSISIGLGYAISVKKSALENHFPKWFDQINAAIAMVIAFWYILSMLFRNPLLLPTGGFIILFTGTYLYLRFSSARFYLRLNVPIHLVLLCSYPLIAFPVWKLTVKGGIAEGIPAIFDMMLMGMIFIPGIILLVAGLIGLLISSKSRE